MSEFKPKAILSWSLDVDCPKCKQENDLSHFEHDEESRIAHNIFNNRWDLLKDRKVTCQHCGHEFLIDEVEY